MGYDGDSNYCTYDSVAESDDYKLYAETSFIKVGVDADDTYYVVHHKVNPIIKDTSNDREIADVTVSCSLGNSGMAIKDTSPDDSAVPDKESSYTVGLTVGTSGIDLSVSGTWEFTAQYMTVDNDTDYQDGTYEFFFDFNEENYPVDDNVTLEPGAVISVMTGSNFTMDIDYELQIRQKYEDMFWPWDPEYFRTLTAGFRVDFSSVE